MATTLTPALARDAAVVLERAWLDYASRFQAMTLRACERFYARDWLGIHRDSAARLDLYRACLGQAIASLEGVLGGDVRRRECWVGLKVAYLERVAARSDAELAETFFNSVTRRLFVTVGVDPSIEFVMTSLDAQPVPRADHPPVTTTWHVQGALEHVAADVLRLFPGQPPYGDLSREAGYVADALGKAAGGHVITTLEFARAPFFRNKGAYLVGRAHTLAGTFPIAVAVLNPPDGMLVDAVLTEADDISVVFSFARSYFAVDTGCPSALVSFLRELMPRKPFSELYASIGHNKHGKTEFYRALLLHLESTDDQFEIAPGTRGMVMVVFTMPGFDAVFKIIRDRFEPPKTATREDVREKYAFVFRHDRGGRLVDAQEFEHLKFERRRFSEALVDELRTKASDTVTFDDQAVAFTHLYTERRLTPLDVFLRVAPGGLAERAVIDYGTSLRDLAAANIFPGDLLIKNFGVSRHGRVIFYDYDELCLLSECRFRRLPPPRDLDDELSAEPWFHVGEHDIFPEELLTFLGLTGPLRDLFADAHGDLLTPEYWLAMQEEHRAGQLPDIWPYPPSKRVRRA